MPTRRTDKTKIDTANPFLKIGYRIDRYYWETVVVSTAYEYRLIDIVIIIVNVNV